jgi:hypothetical protein
MASLSNLPRATSVRERKNIGEGGRKKNEVRGDEKVICLYDV